MSINEKSSGFLYDKLEINKVNLDISNSSKTKNKEPSTIRDQLKLLKKMSLTSKQLSEKKLIYQIKQLNMENSGINKLENWKMKCSMLEEFLKRMDIVISSQTEIEEMFKLLKTAPVLNIRDEHYDEMVKLFNQIMEHLTNFPRDYEAVQWSTKSQIIKDLIKPILKTLREKSKPYL